MRDSSDEKKTLREEALEEELWYAIANVANIEEHLIETAQKIDDEEKAWECLKVADFAREIRQSLVSFILSPEKLSEGGERVSKGEIWCAMKHALLAWYHILESIQKLSRMGKKEQAIELTKVRLVMWGTFKKLEDLYKQL